MLTRLREFYKTGVTRDIDFRLKSLRKLRQLVVENEEQISKALWSDLHKSAYESYLTEIGVVVQEIDNHIRHLKRWAKPKRVPTPLFLIGSRSRIVYEPYGVVLIIAPWNYPFQLLLSPLIGAIAAGNCAVLKTSPYVPALSALLMKLIAAAFDPGHAVMLEGGQDVYEALLAERFDYIFFTGSPEGGRVVMKAASEHLTPVTLELGGKSPCIVDKGADIKISSRRIAWGKFLNAGQTCVAPDYLFVHVSQKAALLEQLKLRITEFYGADPGQSPDFPRIIHGGAVDRIEGLLKQGDIVAGGITDREKRYVAPTIIDHVTPAHPVMQQEIFGPVLPVMTFEKLEEAIHYINACEKPLALYYFGSSSRAGEVIAQTSSGGVCVNDTILHIANHHLPFGGVGNSGIGRYHGHDSFLTFSNRRSVLYSPVRWDIPFKYPPYRALAFLKKVM